MNDSLKLALASVEDYRQAAKQKLPLQLFDYIDGAAYQEITATANIQAFEAVKFRQRVMTDVSRISTQTQLLDQQLTLPLVLAPVGLAGSFARRGELQAYRAADRFGIPFCLSTVGICSISELASHQPAQAPFWFQLYVLNDRSYARDLLAQAKLAGCHTLVLTVDLPILAERYRDIRNGLGQPLSLYGKGRRLLDIFSHPRWLWDVPINGKPLVFGNLTQAVPHARSVDDFKAWVDAQFDASMTWQNMTWIRDYWQGNLVIKGIMDGEDARAAIQLGADAVVVSNHGGRQLDGVPATLAVLPEIAKLVAGRCQILLDGGVRSGLDILKAVALGADACLIGRPWAYALAANGEVGVGDLLTRLQREMHVAMALTGCSDLASVTPAILYP